SGLGRDLVRRTEALLRARGDGCRDGGGLVQRGCPGAVADADRDGAVARAPVAGVEVVLTFDNLGEAADEELGLPVGKLPHFTVVEVLPRILSLLDGAGLRATFFVEAINVSRY